MEHRLITGGEEYLPFARSCVAKLKKLGLPYADQSFEVNGASIKVRIQPGHEYIRIEGGGSMELDHGVFDLKSQLGNSTQWYDPAEYVTTPSVDRYNEPFVYTEAGVRKNPADGSNGQSSGLITVRQNGIKGAIYDDRIGASHMPELIEDKSKDPPVRVFSQHDDALRAKKYMSFRCPPSVFTGRCRLYVQALYGAPLYRGNNGTPLVFFSMIEGMSQPPRLVIAGKNIGDEPVTITTSTGLYKDPTNGEHWLIDPTEHGVWAYPLASSATGEGLRKLTLPAAGLPETDMDRIEAYILSVSRPETSRKIQISAQALDYRSMGYGWHWNWSGTQATITINVDVRQLEGNQNPIGGMYPYCMESTRYSIAVEPNRDDGETSTSWTFVFTVMEGPSKWAVPRDGWTICAPAWNGTLYKLTPKVTNLVNCDAPFYSFFKKDDLQVCRFRGTEVLENPFEYTVSEPYFRPYYIDFTGQPVFGEMRTVGELGGRDSYKLKNQDGYFIGNFTFGTLLTFPTFYHGRTEYFRDNEVSGKSEVGSTDAAIMYNQGGEHDREEGYPSYIDGEFVHQSRVHFSNVLGIPGRNRYITPTSYTYEYTLTSFNKNVSYGAIAEIVVPEYDSEAIYARCEAQTNTFTTGKEISTRRGGYKTTYRYTETGTYYETHPVYGEPYKIATGHWESAGAEVDYYGNATVQLDEEVASTEELDTEDYSSEWSWSLVCRAGVITTRDDYYISQAFHSDEYLDIPWAYPTRTGVSFSVADAVAMSDIIGPIESIIDFPVIVGYT